LLSKSAWLKRPRASARKSVGQRLHARQKQSVLAGRESAWLLLSASALRMSA